MQEKVKWVCSALVVKRPLEELRFAIDTIKKEG